MALMGFCKAVARKRKHKILISLPLHAVPGPRRGPTPSASRSCGCGAGAFASRQPITEAARHDMHFEGERAGEGTGPCLRQTRQPVGPSVRVFVLVEALLQRGMSMPLRSTDRRHARQCARPARRVGECRSSRPPPRPGPCCARRATPRLCRPGY